MKLFLQQVCRLVHCGLITLVSFVIILYFAQNVRAQSYTPPTHITVQMYAFNLATGEVIRSCLTPAEPNGPDNLTGCTAFPGNENLRYPFASNPATVKIDGTVPEDRYLLDVVPQEMSPGTHLLPALQAQAIAARTYAFWHIRTDAVTPGAINNLEDYQVFIPRTSDRLATAEQQRLVDAAVLQHRYYLSYKESYTVSIYGQTLTLSDEEPIFAEFSADVREQTVANPPFPYLQSVADPISSHPQVPALDGHGHGMSQNGAGRWARGSESYRCDPHPAPCEPPPNPPLQAWSVRWEDAFQILTHYYTGIHLRDANNGNQVVTPAYRWVPLRTGTLFTCAGRDSYLTVTVQNTGTVPWPANAATPVFTNLGEAAAAEVSAPQAAALPYELAPGAVGLVSLSIRIARPGLYRYRLDFYLSGVGLLHDQSPRWPRYEEFTVEVADCAHGLYAPLVMRSPIVTDSSH